MKLTEKKIYLYSNNKENILRSDKKFVNMVNFSKTRLLLKIQVKFKKKKQVQVQLY